MFLFNIDLRVIYKSLFHKENCFTGEKMPLIKIGTLENVRLRKNTKHTN